MKKIKGLSFRVWNTKERLKLDANKNYVYCFYIKKKEVLEYKDMYNIIIFLGPSGSGKSTLQKALGFRQVITWTSRQPRPGEIDGVHYHFATKEEILNMYKDGLLLEFTEYNDNVYGMSLNSIEKLIESNSYASISVDFNGARKLKNKFPSSVLVVGVLVSYEDCRENLISRKEKNINERLDIYSKDINSMLELSDIIINNSKSNWAKVNNIIQMFKNKYCKEGL